MMAVPLVVAMDASMAVDWIEQRAGEMDETMVVDSDDSKVALWVASKVANSAGHWAGYWAVVLVAD